MHEEVATIYVVDDDASVRAGLGSLFRSVGYEVHGFASPREFLLHRRSDALACLVLDIRMPEANGLDFQAELVAANEPIPIVFLTGHGDVPMSVRAIKAGAVEFLQKPFREQDLLDAIRAALERDRIRRRNDVSAAESKARLATLSAREKEVMALVAAGRLNKQIAAELNLSEITVKVHRGQVMRKMRADTLADLIRMADALGVSPGAALRR